jgi:hypothetical protein
MSYVDVASWRRSTRCEGGACVEVAVTASTVAVRNSVSPEVSVGFSALAWQEFVAGVHAGEFDRQAA